MNLAASRGSKPLIIRIHKSHIFLQGVFSIVIFCFLFFLFDWKSLFTLWPFSWHAASENSFKTSESQKVITKQPTVDNRNQI